MKKNKWNIPASIELEYDVPEGSDAVKEVQQVRRVLPGGADGEDLTERGSGFSVFGCARGPDPRARLGPRPLKTGLRPVATFTSRTCTHRTPDSASCVTITE